MKFLLVTIFLSLLFPVLAQKPGNVYPKNGQILSDTSITLQWDAHPNATLYQLTLASDSLFQNLLVNAQSTTDNRQPITLNSNSTYYGFITYFNPLDTFPSDTFSFTVFCPKDEDSLLLWFDSHYNLEYDGLKRIHEWGSMNDTVKLRQSVTGSKPLFIDSTYKAFPSVHFDGSQFLLGSQIPLDCVSVFVFHKLSEFSTYKTIISQNNSWNNGFSINILNSIQMNRFGIGSSFNSEYGLNYINFSTIYFLDVRKISKTHRICGLNSSWRTPFSTNQNYTSVNTNLKIGKNYDNYSWFYKGDIFEIIIYHSFVNTNMLLDYFSDKYTPPVNLGPNILRRYGFCDTVLRTTDMYESYLWSTGDTTREINIGYQDTGWYWCEVPNLFGDIMRDSVYVYNLLPQQDIQDTTICLGDTITYISSFAQGYQIPNIQPGTLNLELGTLNIQPTTNNQQPTTDNPQPTTENGQPTTNNQQPTTPYNGYTFLWQDVSSGDTLSNSPALTLAPSYSRTFVLSVKDSLDCFITDTFTIHIDSFPATTTLGLDKSLCTGDKIGLETNNIQADSFLWNTGHQDSLLTINTAGSYSLQTWNARGCLAKDTVEVDIHGVTPYVAFSAFPVCFGDSTTFIDSSMSLDQSNLISWEIDLGDGSPVRPLAPSPFRYKYTNDSLFTARLTVSTDSGCTNYAYRQVLVRPLPQPDFTPLTACQNHEVQLQNLTLHGDSLVSFYWNFGNGIDTLQSLTTPYNPLPPLSTIYNQSGQYQVSLLSTDIHGCSSSLTKSFNVRPSPQANFTYTPVCDGTPVSFSDLSNTESYNPIQTWHWTIASSPTLLVAQSPSHLFPASGHYPVSLQVTALNGCWDTLTQSIHVHDFPVADFQSPVFCENTENAFINLSQAPTGDSIDFYHWKADNKAFSTAQYGRIAFNDTLSHTIELYVRTTIGCSDTIFKTVRANPNPIAAFTFDKQYGLPPLEVNFINTSVILSGAGACQLPSANCYTWSFGDGSQSNLLNPSHTYLDSATFYPMLLVSDTLGCKDSISNTIYAIYASIDVAITDVVATEKDGYIQYACDVYNFGKQPVKALEFSARYNDGISISESWSGNLLSGQGMTYTFNSRTKIDNIQNLRYYCMDVALPPSANQEDELLSNNTMCKDWSTALWVGEPYPNPTSKDIKVDVVLPYKQSLSFTITTLQGQTVEQFSYEGQKGLNLVQLKLPQVQTGQYTLIIQTKEKREVRTFMVE